MNHKKEDMMCGIQQLDKAELLEMSTCSTCWKETGNDYNIHLWNIFILCYIYHLHESWLYYIIVIYLGYITVIIKFMSQLTK